MSHFVRATSEGSVLREDTGRGVPVLRLRKSERKERMGLNPPTSKLSPQAVSCDIYLLRWFCQKPSGLAVPPPTLWYAAWFLAGCPQRKRGWGVSQGDPHRKIHRVHLETPHTILYTHTNSSPDDARGKEGGVSGGWGLGHWLLLKGQWFVSSTIWWNTAHI